DREGRAGAHALADVGITHRRDQQRARGSSSARARRQPSAPHPTSTSMTQTTRARNPPTDTPIGTGAGRAGLTEADLRPSATPPRPIHPPKSPQIPSKASPDTLDFHRSSDTAVRQASPVAA